MRYSFIKHSILWALPVLIVIVCGFSIVPAFKEFQHGFNGDSTHIKYPGLTLNTFKNHEFQKYTEHLIETKIRFRPIFIKVNSQLYYSLFKKSFAEDSTLIIGKNHQFLEMQYVLDYCFYNKEREQLTAWADHIKKIHDFMIANNKAFIYIITPSKAEHMPEAIPNRFHCTKRGIKETVYVMDKLLTERHIPHVNGPQLMLEATKKYNMPMFPPGGVHWHWLGSTVEAEAIVKLLNKTYALGLPQLEFNYSMAKPNAKDTDHDLWSIAKLWKPGLNYKVPQMQFLNPPYKGKPITLSVIGGSFNWSLNKIFLQNKMFSKIDYYFYFNQHETLYTRNQPIVWTTDISIDAILQSDVIILEENSSLLVSDHGKRFFDKIQFA